MAATPFLLFRIQLLAGLKAGKQSTGYPISSEEVNECIELVKTLTG